MNYRQLLNHRIHQMALTILVLVSYLITTSIAQADSSSRDLKRFESDKIVPDVVDAVPGEIMNVKYGDDQEVAMGNVLFPEDVKISPATLTFSALADKFYTVLMVDPDAISRTNPLYRSWLHWIVVNIPGGEVTRGQTLANYTRPNPAKGTELHRYVFLSFQQLNGTTHFDEPLLTSSKEQTTIRERGKFSVREFAKKYSLGQQPVAGNFFQAKWEGIIKD